MEFNALSWSDSEGGVHGGFTGNHIESNSSADIERWYISWRSSPTINELKIYINGDCVKTIHRPFPTWEEVIDFQPYAFQQKPTLEI